MYYIKIVFHFHIKLVSEKELQSRHFIINVHKWLLDKWKLEKGSENRVASRVVDVTMNTDGVCLCNVKLSN